MKKIILSLFFALASCNVFSATTAIAINNTIYTQIAGPGGSGYAITAFQASQCAFGTSRPALSTVGHKIAQAETLPIDSMGSGIYLWCKSDPTAVGVNYINVTPAADAAIAGTGGATDVNLTKVSGTNVSLGQTTMSASIPVVVASNQGALAVSASALPLPTGAATATAQATTNTKLDTINSTLGSPLQAGGAVIAAQAAPTSTQASVTLISSTALEASHVISAGAANLLGCVGYSNKSTSQYIQFFNSASVPADTTAPYIAPIYVPATSNFSIDFGATGLPFSTGIAASNSSTAATKTIGSSDVWFTCRIK